MGEAKSSQPTKKFTLALVQMSMAADGEANLRTAADRIKEAARARANVICLPELFQHRYFCQSEDEARFALAEAIPGPTSTALSKAAAENHVTLVAPLFERRAAGLYHNSAAVIDAGGELRGVYRKMHIPDDPRYHEKFYFAPGDTGFCAFETAACRIAPLICWDQWFPEAARIATLAGAELLAYPTAIGWLPEEKKSDGEAQVDAWRTIQRAHAIANGVYVAAANRVGFEPHPEGRGGIEFWGNSFICDPSGRVIAEAARDREEILMAEIDLGRIDEERRGWPFLRDRRADAYRGLDRLYFGPAE